MTVKMVYFPVAAGDDIPSGRIPGDLAEIALDTYNRKNDLQLSIYQFSQKQMTWFELVSLLAQ